MPIFAGTARYGTRHAWIPHGPESAEKAWKRLRWSDWLLAQRLLGEVSPERQPDGRWRFTSGAWLRAGRRPVGVELVAQQLGGYLTPVTFYRIGGPF